MNVYQKLSMLIIRIMAVLILVVNVSSIIAQMNGKMISGDGLTGHYYQNYSIDTTGNIVFSNLTEPFSRRDSIIDFWDGDGYYRFQPVAGYGDHYSVQWKGYIYIEEAGQYGFGTISDDGSQIFIDSVLIVDNAEQQWFDWEDNMGEGDTSRTPFQPFILDSGFHDISIRFYEDRYYDGIELWWLKPGADSSDIPYYGTNFGGIAPTLNPNTNWEIIPKNVLYTNIDTLTIIESFDGLNEIPCSIQLVQNYPNPFNPQTTIEFSLLKPVFVTLKIFNITGELVGALVSENFQPGTYKYQWNAVHLPNGVYFYRLSTNERHLVKKAIFIK